MATITGLEIQKKNKDRINLFIGGEFFCGMTLDDCVRYKLAVGQDMTEADLGNLRANSHETDLFNKALVYLLKSPKTQRQIRDYLLKKQADGEEVVAVIGRLEKLGYINDGEYAARFVEAKSHKSGAKVIRQKLIQKGVAREAVDEAVLEIGDQSELAIALTEKYMRNKAWGQKEKAGLGRYLMSKGFDWDTISATINRWRAENAGRD